MQPCGPILKSYLSFPIKLRIGIISAFATIMVHCFITSCFALIHTRPQNVVSGAEIVLDPFCVWQMAAIGLCLVLGLEDYWKRPPVETTVDDFNRVKYQPKPSLPRDL